MTTRPTTGLHGLDITIHGESANAETVDTLLGELFGLSFGDFSSGTKTQASARAYDCSYTYQNKLFMYVGGRTRNNSSTLHICIKGSAFDSGLVDPERIRFWCRAHHVTATDLDIYNDDAGDYLDVSGRAKMTHF
jgi:hypothetical protein